MFNGYCLLWINWLHYWGWQLRHLWAGLQWASLRNVLMLVIGLPVVLLLLHLHWFFLLVDELVFAGYRRVVVSKPVFIVGVPRSGTTFLQRTLGDDSQFTTTTLQECLLTPAISQRYVARALGWFAAPLLGLGKRLLAGKRLRFSQKMDDVHPLGLDEAEEDFLLLLPVLGCFIQMVVFPQHAKTWRLGFFDEQISDWQKRAILGFYRALVQRHLYFHGQDKTYLAKNPSFTSMIGSLKEVFPDATIVACVRTPAQALPSQIRSLTPALELLGHDVYSAEFTQRITALLAHYYREIERWAAAGNTLYVLEFSELTEQLLACIHSLYRHAGLALTPDLDARYQQLAQQNKQFRSQKYSAGAGTQESFQHLWPLSGSSRLIGSTEIV
ncbi:sulfotransferase family protein [Halioxenophilus aromaticivorans]|uniref:Sulfotransferase n=1 Tax=Halioxenophilus aromaticivorans TaxID=1306992 RepID=A0AAV3UAB5_9ALTE